MTTLRRHSTPSGRSAGAAADSAWSGRRRVDDLVVLAGQVEEDKKAALAETLALVAATTWTAPEAVGWWRWARALGMKGASVGMAEALGVPMTTLSTWDRFPEAQAADLRGVFPLLLDQFVPPAGTAVVYALLSSENQVLYIGRTMGARGRLRTHHQEGRVPASAWELHVCSSLGEASALEADLIFQHQPPYNTNLRDRRRAL